MSLEAATPTEIRLLPDAELAVLSPVHTERAHPARTLDTVGAHVALVGRHGHLVRNMCNMRNLRSHNMLRGLTRERIGLE